MIAQVLCQPFRRSELTIHPQTRMSDWLAQRSVMLDELLRMDGLGSLATPGKCAGCMERVGEYRCEECLGGNLFCSACIVSSHRQLPLHRIQVRIPVSHELHCVNCALTTGLGERLFRGRDAREPWSHCELWALRELLPLSCRAPADPCYRPFGSSHGLRSFLQVF
jgi:hypothetical protein